MSGRQQLERLIRIDREIRENRYPNAKKLANALEVCERTIYQDRQFLQDRLGAPIYFHRKYKGWYYKDPNWVLPSVTITEGELLAFFLSMEVTRRYLGTTFEVPLRSAIEKITSVLKDEVKVHLEDLRSSYSIAALPVLTVDEKLLLDLHNAIKKCHRVKIHYYTASRDCWQTRVVEPYHLFNLCGDWYLIAFDHQRKEMRTFHAGRIKEWELQSEGFKRDTDFTVENYMSTAFQAERGNSLEEVVIKFDSHQARYIRERCWHATQEIEELEQGSLLLRFQSGALAEIKRWVMYYGSHAEVLTPENLRNDVFNEARLMVELYQKNDTAE